MEALNQIRLEPQAISTNTLQEKYCKGDETTELEIFQRVAKGIASCEKTPALKKKHEKAFLKMMQDGGIGGGRIMGAAGTDISATLINCFLEPIGDSILGFDDQGYPGIYSALSEAAETFKRGGGVGYDFSSIRPKNSYVKGVDSFASGPCSYMDVFDASAMTMESAGSRRSAQLSALRIDHPDIEEFIVAKRTKGRWNNFNVSVFVTDAFMDLVKNDGVLELTHKARPTEKLISENHCYQREDGIWVYKTLKAVDLWNAIMKSNYDFAEPGILFADNINNDNNLRYCEEIRATNPCVTGDTIILTDKGYVRIDSVIDKEVTIWNGFEWSIVTPIVTGEDQEIYDLVFSDGSKLACTPYHKFILDSGERIEAYNLLPSQKLASWTTPDGVEMPAISLLSKTLRLKLEEKVYCFTEEKNHSGIFNGIMTAQCGEQPLPPYGCCDLGAIILPKFVKYPFTKQAEVDFIKLESTVTSLVRFLDNVLDVTFWPLEQQKIEAQNKRRIGLGFTGLANSLAMLNLRYNSDDGRKMAETISSFITYAAYRASVDLAKEKGPFPFLDVDKYLEEGTFASRLPDDIKEGIRKHGIRNSHLTTVAPCGTISLAFADNASNGIEPPFSLAYTRKKRKQHGGEEFYTVMDHGLRVFLAKMENRDIAEAIEKALCNGEKEFSVYNSDKLKIKDYLPDSIVTALEITAEDHLAMMRVIRPYICSSISKTVNVPVEYPFDDFKNIYLKAHEYGLKGVATYHPNNILGSVLSEIKKEEPKVGTSATKVINANEEFEIFMNKVIHQLPEDEYPAIRKRVDYLGPEGKDNFYLLVSLDRKTFVKDGKTIVAERPVEVFIETNPDNVPSEWVDSLSRNLSLLARSGINLFTKALDNCKKAKSDKGRIRYGFITKADGTQVPRYHASQIDCIGFAVKEILLKRNIINEAGKYNTLEELIKLRNQVTEEVVQELTSEPSKVESSTKIFGKVCAECGDAAVIKKDGCEFCTNCGAQGSCG